MHREARAHSMKKYYRLLLCSLIPLVAAALLASLFIVFTLRRQAFEQFHEVAEIYLDSIDLSLSTIQRQIRWSAMRDESFQAIANPHSLAELTDSLKTMRGQFNTLQQSTGSHFQFFGYVPADGFFFNCAALEVDYGAYLGLKERLAQLIAAPNPVYDWSLLSSRGVDYLYCMIGMAVLTGIYVLLGGYMATAINDFIQGIIMLAGIAAVVTYIVRAAGGISGGIEALSAEGMGSLLPPEGKGSWLLSNVLLTSMGVLGMPQMIHKFFAIRDEDSVKRATVISTAFALIVAGGAYFAGSFGRVVLAKIAAPDGVGAAASPAMSARVLSI